MNIFIHVIDHFTTLLRLALPSHFVPSSLPLSFPHTSFVITPSCALITTVLAINPLTLVTLFIFYD
jgi:hypothetical protein